MIEFDIEVLSLIEGIKFSQKFFQVIDRNLLWKVEPEMNKLTIDDYIGDLVIVLGKESQVNQSLKLGKDGRVSCEQRIHFFFVCFSIH